MDRRDVFPALPIVWAEHDVTKSPGKLSAELGAFPKGTDPL